MSSGHRSGRPTNAGTIRAGPRRSLATFINVPSNQVDEGIRDAQQRIVDALDLDRCTLSVAEAR